jgi:membrane-associated protein
MMEFIREFIDIFLHLDKHLTDVTSRYGTLTYAILFAIIFCETGLVVTPILPGDSLLFAGGALAALGSLNVWIMGLIIFVAAVLGDMVNYWAGHYFGARIFKPNARFLKVEYLVETERFYEKYGAKTIVLCRFVPIIRTFAPFVAGMGRMRYGRFFAYNVIGALAWVLVCVGAGYFFGNIPVVKKNFTVVILAIIFISVLPAVIGFIQARRSQRPGPAAPGL